MESSRRVMGCLNSIVYLRGGLMKFIKISSILLMSLFILCAFTPEANAKHHHRYKSRSSFGLSFNVAPSPSYVVAPAPVAVMPYRSVAPVPVYPYPYYYAPAPVYVERPMSSVYIQPGFSYSYWRY